MYNHMGIKKMKVKYATMIVQDMDESVKFYRDVLGLEIDSEHNPFPGLTITIMKGEGDARIELIENKEDDIGLYSVGIEVEDINATLDELKSKGANIIRMVGANNEVVDKVHNPFEIIIIHKWEAEFELARKIDK